MARAVTLVCTPAGFGKTSLLADWAARAGWSVAWLSLDPEDSNPARFGGTWWSRSIVPSEASASACFHSSVPRMSRRARAL